MKNSQIYCFTLCIWLFSCQDHSTSTPLKTVEKPKDTYSLHINIKNIPNGKAFLNIVVDRQLQKIDSTSLQDKEFVFSGEVKSPTPIWITFDYTSQGLHLVLESSVISINAEALHLNEATIHGGPLNKELHKFKTTSALILSKIDTRYQRFQKARLENNSEQLSIIHKEISNIRHSYLNFCLNYIQQHPDSFISLIVLNDLIDEKIDKKILKQSLASCSTRVKGSSYAEAVNLRIKQL